MDYENNSGEGNFRTLLYAATAIIGLAGLYVAYLYVTSSNDFGFDIEWKFWNSTVLWPALSVVGFFLQFIDWQHTSFTEGWVVKDSWGNEKFVENNDIMSWLWGNCLFPLLAHFLLIPCLYGAMLYYVVMLPVALIGALIPYLAALLAIGVAALFYSFARNFDSKSNPLVWLAGTAVVCLGLLFLLSLPTSSDFSFGSTKSSESSAPVSPTPIGHATVTATTANLRMGPGTSYDLYLKADGEKLQLSKGDDIQILEDTGEWFRILTSDGGTAYVKKTLCTDMESYAVVEEPEEIFSDNSDEPEVYDSVDISDEAEKEAAKKAAKEAMADPIATIPAADQADEEVLVEKQGPVYDDVFDVVEQMPQFPGGDAALMNYISSHLKYPVVAEENGIQGRVICQFIVEKDGSITNVNVLRGVDQSLDKEAVRVLKSMPRWVPGKQNGSAVRVKYTLPVTFKLQP